MAKQITRTGDNCFVYTQDEVFNLVNKQSLESLCLAFEVYGELNTAKDNVIVIHHSLSTSAHAANLATPSTDFDYNHRDDAGWWDSMIGSGKALDPDEYCIICINNIGSCYGSTGPSDYPHEFPVITMHDIVNSQKLVLDQLGITKVKLLIGGSMGGMISLAWLQMYPNDLENIFLVACSHKAYPINVFNRMIQREILKLDQDKSSGQKQGLKIARMLGYYNYRSNSELEDRFGNVNSELAGDRALADSEAYKNTELYNYFSYNADKFIKNFDADSYNVLLNAMDLFDLSKENAYHAAGYPSVNNECNIIVVGIDTDILFPIWQQQEIVDLLRACGYDPYFIEHVSPFGHDAFFIEHEAFSGYISRLLTKRKNKSGYKTRRARLS